MTVNLKINLSELRSDSEPSRPSSRCPECSWSALCGGSQPEAGISRSVPRDPILPCQTS